MILSDFLFYLYKKIFSLTLDLYNFKEGGEIKYHFEILKVKIKFMDCHHRTNPRIIKCLISIKRKSNPISRNIIANKYNFFSRSNESAFKNRNSGRN